MTIDENAVTKAIEILCELEEVTPDDVRYAFSAYEQAKKPAIAKSNPVFGLPDSPDIGEYLDAICYDDEKPVVVTELLAKELARFAVYRCDIALDESIYAEEAEYIVKLMGDATTRKDVVRVDTPDELPNGASPANTALVKSLENLILPDGDIDVSLYNDGIKDAIATVRLSELIARKHW